MNLSLSDSTHTHIRPFTAAGLTSKILLDAAAACEATLDKLPEYHDHRLLSASQYQQADRELTGMAQAFRETVAAILCQPQPQQRPR